MRQSAQETSFGEARSKVDRSELARPSSRQPPETTVHLGPRSEDRVRLKSSLKRTPLCGGGPASGIPASGLPASGTPPSGTPPSGLPASAAPASGVPASRPPASGTPPSGGGGGGGGRGVAPGVGANTSAMLPAVLAFGVLPYKQGTCATSAGSDSTAAGYPLNPLLPSSWRTLPSVPPSSTRTKN